MSLEMIGIALGIAFTLPTILLFRRSDIENWAWPFFLGLLPVFYMLFGMLALDGRAILLEFLVGIPYFILGLLLWKKVSRSAVAILGMAWLSHGFYDYFHDLLFINSGVFAWYPVFCAVVDIIVGLYLLNFAVTMDDVKATR